MMTMTNIPSLPIPANHLGSASASGAPLSFPDNFSAGQLSRRDFMRLGVVATAAGILLPSTKPVAAQSMTSTERELLLLAIDAARNAGATGGKLIGAGGRGFLLLFSEPDSQSSVRKSLPELQEVTFSLTDKGSRIIFSSDQ